MKLKDKTVLVVGFGTTGKAACRFLLEKGARVRVSENRPAEEIGEISSEWTKRGVHMETGGHNFESFLDADLIITSPGIPDLPVFKEASRRGKQIISEVELASWYVQGRIAGITGSNGKSTVASLTYKILKDAGCEVYLAGNIGTPLISLAEKGGGAAVYVTELSSFQLSRIKSFSVDAAVILNFSPDHIDWHYSYENYIDSKLNLLRALKPGGTAVLNRDDPLVWGARKKSSEKIYGFSRTHGPLPGCWLEKGWIQLNTGTPEPCMPVSDIPLTGIHNQENVMASALTARIFGAPAEIIRRSVIKFKGLEHRLEQVRILDGIVFYDDSKATNVDAALKSIQSFDPPIILIMGGRDKGGDFSRLIPEIKKRCKKIILLGESRTKIRRILNGTVSLEEADSMQAAVKKSFSSADAGDTVILAPACTSFDMFENFEHRGRVFKQEVRSLKSGKVGF
jgi:UDP-N-acetylmuramoylalanine--D-glutamate ligase